MKSSKKLDLGKQVITVRYYILALEFPMAGHDVGGVPFLGSNIKDKL